MYTKLPWVLDRRITKNLHKQLTRPPSLSLLLRIEVSKFGSTAVVLSESPVVPPLLDVETVPQSVRFG